MRLCKDGANIDANSRVVVKVSEDEAKEDGANVDTSFRVVPRVLATKLIAECVVDLAIEVILETRVRVEVGPSIEEAL